MSERHRRAERVLSASLKPNALSGPDPSELVDALVSISCVFFRTLIPTCQGIENHYDKRALHIGALFSKDVSPEFIQEWEGLYEETEASIAQINDISRSRNILDSVYDGVLTMCSLCHALLSAYIVARIATLKVLVEVADGQRKKWESYEENIKSAKEIRKKLYD